ncbi:MAG: hypothetical protein EBR10_09195 [Planctomycetes bacterium]|nr:hypothetical protein [Planctomycetota bacterium]
MSSLTDMPTNHAARRGAVWLALLVAGFLLLTWPVILLGGGGTSEAWDQDEHHVHVIERFSAALRKVDGAPSLREALADYPSATSPGFHLAVASLDAAGVRSRTVQRLVASLAGATALAVLWLALRRAVDPITSSVLCLPLLASPYFLSGSIWLTTDVSALLWTTVALASLLMRPLTPRWILAAGFAAAVAVFVRQPSVWLAAPIAVAAWTAAQAPCPTGSPVAPRRFDAAICWAALAAILMPCIVLAALTSLWGGLVPPSYRAQHASGFNPALPALALALLGLWGMPWLLRARGWFAPRVLLPAVVLGELVAALPATDFDRASGRWGGPIWQVIERTPELMDRSVIMAILASVGAVIVAAIARLSPAPGAARWRTTLAFAALALVAALSANSQAWERYVDLPLFALLPFAVVSVRGARADWTPNELRLPFLLLAAVQLGLSAVMVYLPTLRG